MQVSFPPWNLRRIRALTYKFKSEKPSNLRVKFYFNSLRVF
ncbi:hypothetical protein CAMSH0001_1240 [Campylobacter showae RM3277]|uniref:Uncharacterized protein n=1 Tax=Campylobacter showae RM3277 TaxID=553219 RepID=C6RDT2_9BACT|nr:hypothetical protein CAMSH0001_1240 [Campylobacter showae RM3277]